MKITIVTSQYPPQIGGVGHSAHRIANMLSRKGLDVHVIVVQKSAEPLPFDECISTQPEGPITVHRVQVFHEGLRADSTRSESEILTRFNRELFQAVLHLQNLYQYDLLHGFFLYPAGYVAAMVGSLCGKKVVVSIRGNDVGKYVFDPIRLPFIRIALEKATYVTSVASNLIDLADRTLVPIRHKSKTILNSVDLEKLKITFQPDLPLRGLVIGTTGLFRYKKGLIYLFKALANLKDELEFTLLLAGDFFKPEDKEPHLHALRQYNLSDRTIITGKIPSDQMANYLQLFDILVYPSLYSEGCPLSMLEAMALGRAIIGSHVGAIPEILSNRENGILVQPGNSKDIEQAIRELAGDNKLRERLGAAAKQTVQQLNNDVELDQWLEIYENMLK